MAAWNYGAGFVWELFRREIKARYASSVFGLLSLFILPMLNIAIYVFVFSVIFDARIPKGLEQQNFFIFLCAGLIPWMALSEVVSRALGLFQEFAVILRKINVSIFVLVGYAVLHAIVLFFIYLGTFFIATALVVGVEPLAGIAYSIALTPLLIIFLTPIVILISVSAVYLPDIRTFTPVALQILFWLTPICYSYQALSPAVRSWFDQAILFNPAFGLVASFQDVIFLEQFPTASHVIHVVLWSAIFTILGISFYRVNRDTLVDRI